MSITTAGPQCTDKPYSAIDMQWLCKMNCKLELNYRRMVIFRLFDIQGLLVIWIHFLHQTENNYVNMTNISVFFLKLSANSWSVWNEQLSILKKCNAFFRSYMTYFARCFLLFFFEDQGMQIYLGNEIYYVSDVQSPFEICFLQDKRWIFWEN